MAVTIKRKRCCRSSTSSDTDPRPVRHRVKWSPLTNMAEAGTAQQGLEALNLTEVADTPFEVGLWRLGANRCGATETMVDVILKVLK